MTVVAAYRGVKQSLNVLMVDTVCLARDKPSEAAFWSDKIGHVYGNTYVTAVGDADIVNASRLVVDFLDPKRPNFRDPKTIDAILGAAERIWAVRAHAGGQRHGSKGSVLFVANRGDVFYWVCGYDNETLHFERPQAPHEVDEGTCVVFWGSDRSTIRQFDKLYDDIRANPFNMIATIIRGVDADARAGARKGLTYPLEEWFSGVVLPHKSSTPLMRLRPFSLPESLIRERGPGFLQMLDDDEFMNYSLPQGE